MEGGGGGPEIEDAAITAEAEGSEIADKPKQTKGGIFSKAARGIFGPAVAAVYDHGIIGGIRKAGGLPEEEPQKRKPLMPEAGKKPETKPELPTVEATPAVETTPPATLPETADGTVPTPLVPGSTSPTTKAA